MKRVSTLLVSILIVIGLVVGCAGLQGKPAIDQAIQFRSQFNLIVKQFSQELNVSPLPMEEKQAWADKAIPVVILISGILDTMDAMVATGGEITPDQLQGYLDAKNKLIDLLAKFILASKGGK